MSLSHIVQACIPNGEVKDYKVTFDGSENIPTPNNYYICDASCRVVVECLSASELKERRLRAHVQRQLRDHGQAMLNMSCAGSQAFRMLQALDDINRHIYETFH